MVQCDPRRVDVAEAADVLLAILQVRDLYHQADTGNQKEEKKTKHSSLYLRSSDGTMSVSYTHLTLPTICSV